MYQKALTTFTVCFYYAFFLASVEAMVWVEKSSIVILSFLGAHMSLKLIQWVDHFTNKDQSLHPYRTLSAAMRTAVILSDTLATFLVLFGFLYIESIEDEDEEEIFKFRYVLCSLCIPICIVNILKHHKRQVEAATVDSNFSENFSP